MFLSYPYPFSFMVAGSILAGASAAIPFLMNVGAKTSKFYGKHGNTSLGQASQFGLGYGISTNIGYNTSNQFITSSWRGSDTKFIKEMNYINYNKMPYRRFNRYSRYGRRYSRYGRRYSRYGRRSYYGRRYY